MTSTTTAGFTLKPVFTAPGAHNFDGVEFTLRDALILSGSGKTVFEQKDCEVPTSWSQTATNIVASKYFHGAPGTPEREHSVKQLITRVV
jgi:ribonucleoside-diphosphate reductase alpha chain